MEDLYWMAYPIPRHNFEDRHLYYYNHKLGGDFSREKPDCLICNEYDPDKYKFTCEFAPIINVPVPLCNKAIKIVYEFLKYHLPNELIDIIVKFSVVQERQLESYYISKKNDVKKLFRCPDCAMDVIKLVENLCCDKHVMNRLSICRKKYYY